MTHLLLSEASSSSKNDLYPPITPLSQTRLTPPVCLSHLAAALMSKRDMTSCSDVCWRTRLSPTSPSVLRAVGVACLRAWTWRSTGGEEPWSKTCRGHSMDAMFVQAGRMEGCSHPDLLTCLSSPVRPVCLSVHLSIHWSTCWWSPGKPSAYLCSSHFHFTYLSNDLSVYLSVCLPFHLSTCLQGWASLPPCLSVRIN